MTKLKAYSYIIKAFESEGDWIHDDYITIKQFYIPSENLTYNFYKQSLNTGNPIIENFIEYLKNKNMNLESISYTKGDLIYNLTEIELEQDFVSKLKQFHELDKQRKKLCEDRKSVV